MNTRFLRVITLVITLILAFSTIGCSEKTKSPFDKDLEKKAVKVLKKLNTKQKVGQLIQLNVNMLWQDDNPGVIDQVKAKQIFGDYAVGSLLITDKPNNGDVNLVSLDSWQEMISQIKNEASKHNDIPVIFGIDAVHGFHFIPDGTYYPHNIGLAATYNEELVKKSGEYTAKELAKVGIQWNFSPVIDVATDPRWGRTYETFGEDPYISGKLGSALVEGYQESGKVAACGKHYVGYSAPVTGHDREPAEISEISLNDYHLPPYQAAIQAGLHTVMVNSGEVNGYPANGSKWLLTDVLKNQLEFAGFAISDISDVTNLHTKHKVASTLQEAQELAFNAGLDMNMVPSDLETADAILKAVEEKKISMSRIDDAVKRILMVKLSIGMFDDTDVETLEEDHREKANQISYELAKESIILLNNDGTLPLKKDYKNILVVGMASNSFSMLNGGWTYEWGGIQEGTIQGTTILGAIKEKASGTKITYIEDFFDYGAIRKAAKMADVIIACLGEKPYAEWLGDVTTLSLAEEEQMLLDKLWDVGPPLVTVYVSGRPLTQMNWSNEMASASLWAPLPGNMGAKAIVDVLFGDYNPSGKSPMTIPKNDGQLPLTYNARINTKYEPAFPFGHGLSYSTFEYSDLNAPETIKAGEPLKVTVTVKNTSKIDGTETALIFMSDEYAPCTRPMKQLVAYNKRLIKANETSTLEFEISPEQLKLVDYEDPDRMKVDVPRKIIFTCGKNKLGEDLTCEVVIEPVS